MKREELVYITVERKDDYGRPRAAHGVIDWTMVEAMVGAPDGKDLLKMVQRLRSELDGEATAARKEGGKLP